MIYIYKLKFNTPVHFGNGNLDDTEISFRSDRLFSALMIESYKKYDEVGIKKIVDLVKSGQMLLTDAMPYYENEYFVPKPFTIFRKENSDVKNIKSVDQDNNNKKKLKKMKYIPISELHNYINNSFDNVSIVNQTLSRLGSKNYNTKSYINDEKTEPYQIVSYTFSEKAGLYFVLDTESDDINNLVEELLANIALCGIGGKRSSGYGKCDISKVDMKDDIYGIYKKYIEAGKGVYMSLSVSLPKENEIDNALDNATYNVIRSGGFVDSSYEIVRQVKKKNLYCLASGSCFANRYEGDIYNVSFDEMHPVYRYAKPFFITIG